ncbi:MAG: hypothetical protein QXY18_05800 [Nitrososphaerota archaeon]
MKIYDCFTFFNELDLLEIRLNVLNEIVDKFVIVEANKTHTGKVKPLYFEKNIDRFEKFLDKIVYIKIDFPNGLSSWGRENFQRNKILEGLKDASEDDLIIISDLDEIPKPSILKDLTNSRNINILRGPIFYYFLNYKAFKKSGEDFLWNGPVVFKYKEMIFPQKMRQFAIFQNCILNHSNLLSLIKNQLFFNLNKIYSKTSISIIDNSQWHFSWLGGKEKIIEKLESFAHTELNKEKFKSDSFLDQMIKRGEFFKGNIILKKVELDETFPKYILQNKEKFKHLILE